MTCVVILHGRQDSPLTDSSPPTPPATRLSARPTGSNGRPRSSRPSPGSRPRSVRPCSRRPGWTPSSRRAGRSSAHPIHRRRPTNRTCSDPRLRRLQGRHPQRRSRTSQQVSAPGQLPAGAPRAASAPPGDLDGIPVVDTKCHPLRVAGGNRAPVAEQPPNGWQLAIENRWIRIASRRFIRMVLPWDTIVVGRPVPPGENPITVDLRPGDRGHRPVDVVELDVDDVLRELFTHFDVDGRAASCWNDIDDRMAYIFALLARHQRSSGWWEDDEDGRRLRPGVSVRSPRRPPLRRPRHPHRRAERPVLSRSCWCPRRVLTSSSEPRPTGPRTRTTGLTSVIR